MKPFARTSRLVLRQAMLLWSAAIHRRFLEAFGPGRPHRRVAEKHVAVAAGRSQSGDKSPHSKGPLVFGLVMVCLGLLAFGVGGCKRAREEPQLQSAQEVLDAMVAAYQKAGTYQDDGVIRQRAEVDGRKEDRKAPFSVKLARPNKVRLDVYQAQVACDGEQMFAAIRDLLDQQLVKDAPARMTLDALYSDKLLNQTLTTGIVGAPITLTLLLEKNPLEIILKGAKESVLGKSEEIGGRTCYRVDVEMPTGTGTFWIDRESFVLRRYDYPASRSELAAIAFPGSAVKEFSLSVEFEGAAFDEQIPPEAFQFEVVPGADVRKFFVDLNPAQLLAKKIHDFSFLDLDGNVVTNESLAGRIAVIQFWTLGSTACRDALAQLEKVQALYKNENRIALLAVNVDSQEKDNQALIDYCGKQGIHLPILRDLEGYRVRTFQFAGTPPYTVLLDARGVGQDFDVGPNAALAEQLTEKLERLLVRESVYQKPLQRYRAEIARQERMLATRAAGRSTPAALRLRPLWKSADVKEPGNVLVVEEPSGTPRVLVLEKRTSVAELGLDGKLLATHALDIDSQNEDVDRLRTWRGADGKRYYAAFALAQQRVHVFDAHWKKLFSYPPGALEKESRHAGIGDCTLADLDGDGKPELYIGYLGVVGVQAVSLEGQRLYANRTVPNVFRMAVGSADEQGRRGLFCGTNTESLCTLVMLDAKLERRGDVLLPERPLQWFAAADLAGDGQLQWCGLTSPRSGDNVVVGLNLRGEELWKYTLPEGFHRHAIEPILAGRVTAALPGQWLLPAVDGSLHVLAADGKPLDKFNYGALLSGMATATLDGKPVLIIASSNGLEALRVE